MKTCFSLFFLCLLAIHTAHSAPLRKSLCPTVLSSKSFDSHLSPEVYVWGEGSSQPGHILVLSSAQYEKMAVEDKIPPNVILVLDEISLNVDPPVVQAILVAKPIAMRRTHVETLAEKLSIPFAFVPGLFQLPLFANGLTPRGIFRVVIGDGDSLRPTVNLLPSAEKDRAPIVPSVLPEDSDRSFTQIIGQYQYDQFPIDVVGSKFYSLAKVARKLSDNTPVPLSVSSGYFEEFLDRGFYGTTSLREYLRRQRVLLETEVDLSRQKRILTRMRAAIKDARLPRGNDLFVRLSDQLTLTYGLYTRISVRSNNAEEDLIASGVYQSAVAENATSIELSAVFRKVWASLYSFRAYQIRKLRGQREENLSMPLLVHRYVDGEIASGVGRFQMIDHKIHLYADVTMGNDSKATNPHRNAKNLSMRVYRDPEGTIQADNRNGKSVVAEAEVVIQQLKELFHLMEESVLDSYKNRLYPPSHVDIEYVFVKKRRTDAKEVSFKPIVLQYKEVMSQEIVQDVLTGRIHRSELNRQIVLQKSHTVSEALDHLQSFNLYTFGNAPYEKGMNYRYALFMRDSEPILILWADGREHKSVKVSLTESEFFQWVWGGSLDIKNQKFVFSTTSTQPRIFLDDPSKVRNLFLKALSAGVTGSSGLRSVFLEKRYSLVLPQAFSKGEVSSEELEKLVNP